MLKTRVKTACILLIGILAVIFVFPPIVFKTVCLILTFIAGSEWAAISGWSKLWSRILYGLLTFCILIFGCLAPTSVSFVGFGVAWWLVAIVLIVNYPELKKGWTSIPAKSIIGWLVLIPTFASLVLLREKSKWILFYVLCLTWCADIGAYFFGRWFGCHKLAPLVSPNKTWQGVVGGALFVSILAVIFSSVAGYTFLQTCVFLVVGLITFGFSAVGDLLESMFKREYGLKDSGKIIPGHGGLLDRIDSLTAAAPVFAFLSIYMPWII